MGKGRVPLVGVDCQRGAGKNLLQLRSSKGSPPRQESKVVTGRRLRK